VNDRLDAIAYRKLASVMKPVPLPVCGNCEHWREFKAGETPALRPLDGMSFGACVRFAAESIKSHGSWCGEHELRAE
jgi:hypothetical protein